MLLTISSVPWRIPITEVIDIHSKHAHEDIVYRNGDDWILLLRNGNIKTLKRPVCCKWSKNRSLEGLSKLKSPETKQVYERLVSTFEHLQDKKEEIWLSPMTKASTPTEMSKVQSNNINNATKSSIKQQFRTDLGRTVWVATATQLVWLIGLRAHLPTPRNSRVMKRTYI